ncbi:MAG: ABC transporter ATP-binding protein [Clostridia bacterium]|nr:ABC transporter ATP-binding protein [Clostridia bacterium]
MSRSAGLDTRAAPSCESTPVTISSGVEVSAVESLAPTAGPPASELAVTARGLTKRYGEFVAVRGIDFDVRRGECFGFLGPNGAGKSSTMRMLYGRTEVSGGRLTVLGLDAARDSRQIKLRVGVVPQESNLDSELTVRENLELFARFYGMTRAEARRRADRWLAFVGLQEVAAQRVDELSGGMQRRLVIARALLHEPELVVLDEPTTGLDPAARHAIWQKLQQLKESGVTLILTTHYMDEAHRLCNRLVVMDHGRILAEGPPQSLVEEHVGQSAIELPADWHEAHGAALPAALVRRQLRIGSAVFLYTDDAPSLLEKLHASPQPPRYLARQTNLEDVFLALTGRDLDDDAGDLHLRAAGMAPSAL